MQLKRTSLEKLPDKVNVNLWENNLLNALIQPDLILSRTHLTALRINLNQPKIPEQVKDINASGASILHRIKLVDNVEQTRELPPRLKVFIKLFGFL